jgi:Flp pilus assembly pilin Flp
MRSWLAQIGPLCRDETGGTTVEYALIAALTVAALLLVIPQLRQSIAGSFDRQKNYFEGTR